MIGCRASAPNNMDNVDYSFTNAMRERMEGWLREDEPPLDRLCAWLQGYDVPPAGHDLEPYEWILRGIPVGSDRHPSEVHLAHAVAKFLTAPRNELPALDRPEEANYNALKLAAALGPQRELSAALRALHDSRLPEGEWHGIDLRRCLLDALIENQFDRKLEPLWSEMVEGEVSESRFLWGSPNDGLQGILLMPSDEAEVSTPVLNAIGSALNALALKCERAPNRRQRFRALIQHVKATHVQRPSWDLDLIMLAYEYKWPLWAVESLPRLYIPLQTLEDGKRGFVAWKYLTYPIPEEWGCDVGAQFRNGIVREIFIPPHAIPFLDEVAGVLESVRTQYSDSSERGLVGEVLHEMQVQAVKKHLENQEQLAVAYEQGAKRIYDQINVGQTAVIATA